MTNESPDSYGATWRVTSQLEGLGQNAGGQYVQGVKISFTTASGIAGSVFIPDAEYSRERARAAIAARVAQMLDVHDLNG